MAAPPPASREPASNSSASHQPVIVLENLSKKYGTFTALEDLSLKLYPGQILGLIGPNGAGKTTAIKILVGLIRPTAGTAQIAGADCVRDSHQIKRLVGYMPDSFGAYDNMRVREYLDFFGAAYGLWILNYGVGWTQLHAINSQDLILGDLDGNGQAEILVDFGPTYGFWIYVNNASWIQAHTVSPEGFAIGDLN